MLNSSLKLFIFEFFRWKNNQELDKVLSLLPMALKVATAPEERYNQLIT